jgi:ATP-dependent helicase/DNAse subunit B
MKKQELKLEKVDYTMSANSYPPKSHYKFIMSLGRVFPQNYAQAKSFLTEGRCFDVLNSKDVDIIESLMNKHGLEGDYKYTKSKTWVRLQNNTDFHNALKLEYSL